MSNLLKVKVGGSDYLCKWCEPLFYTNGSREENGKDKPIKGNIANRAFDGTTLYKIKEGKNNLFVSNTNNFYWNGLSLDETPGKKYSIELLFKNIQDPGNLGHLIIFGSRSFELGQHTDKHYIGVGFSNVTGNLTIEKIYLNPNWINVSSYYLDYAWGNPNYPKDKVAIIKAIVEFIDIKKRRLTCFVDDEKIFEYIISGNNFGGYLGTEFNNNGELCFGNIKIKEIS